MQTDMLISYKNSLTQKSRFEVLTWKLSILFEREVRDS